MNSQEMQNKINLHYQHALELSAARLSMLDCKMAPRHALADIDYRLRIHLYYLNHHYEVLSLPNPSDPPAIFLQLALELTHCPLLTIEQQRSIMTELENQSSVASIIAAFQFCPPDDHAAFLLNAYYVNTELRLTCLTVWGALKQPLPTQVIEKALAQPDNILLPEILKQAAYHHQLKLSNFKKIIDETPLTNVKVSALYGLWFYHSPDFIPLLKQFSQDEPLNELEIELHYLMALSGEVDFIDDLIAFSQRNPAIGFNYCALHGHTNMIMWFLDALSDIRYTRFVDAAWYQLTQYTIKRKPVITLLKSNKKSAETIADVADATEWWKKQNWSPNRYFLGAPITVAWLKKIKEQYRGTALIDLDFILKNMETLHV